MKAGLVVALAACAAMVGCSTTQNDPDPEGQSWARCEAALETLGLTGNLSGVTTGVAPDISSVEAGQTGILCIVTDGGTILNVFVPDAGPPVVLP